MANSRWPSNAVGFLCHMPSAISHLPLASAIWSGPQKVIDPHMEMR
jgi:hypothetical protein